MATNKEKVIAVNKRIVELGRERRLAEALAQLDALRAQRLQPSTVTFNVLLSAAARCGDNECAARLLTRMRAEGHQPNVITYATVLKGLCLTGLLDKAEELLSEAEAAGVPPNARVCTAFLRGCMIWGEVDRVVPFVRRMTSHWKLPLEATAVEYAGRALCMGLMVDECSELQQELREPATREGGGAAHGGMGGGGVGGGGASGRPFGSASAQPTAALDIAMAEAHTVLLELDPAGERLSRAERRVASGIDAKLHADRDEADLHGEAMQAFLRHRADETRRELARVRTLAQSVEERTRHAAAEAPPRGAERAKKRRRDEVGATDMDKPPTARQRCQAHLKSMESVYGRVVLLSESTAQLATTPLAAQPAAFGVAPKALRRWRLGALLIARLDARLGLRRLQQRCCAAGTPAAAAAQSATAVAAAAPAAVAAPAALAPAAARRVAKSEARLLKRAKRACNAACHVRWGVVFGNERRVVLEVCSGDGEWAVSQAKAQPQTNWIACECRGDRIHQIASRMRGLAVPNLALLGADAALALRHHTRPKSYDAIYVNFPEPPPEHGNAEDYLLNAEFLTHAHKALRPHGGALYVVSDNPILLEAVATTLLRLMQGGPAPAHRGTPLGFAARTGLDGGGAAPARVTGAASQALVADGVPSGFGVEGTSSYFDRLWESRGKQRRYHIHVVRT
jgi:pentatricopeptide repeat protein